MTTINHPVGNIVEGDKGVWVRLRPRTLLTERTKEKMQIAAALVFEEIIMATQHESQIVDEVLTGYIYVSAQVCDSNGLDFAWLTPADSAQGLISKFQAYVNTKHGDFIRHKVATELFKMNAPFDEAYAPGVVPSDPKS